MLPIKIWDKIKWKHWIVEFFTHRNLENSARFQTPNMHFLRLQRKCGHIQHMWHPLYLYLYLYLCLYLQSYLWLLFIRLRRKRCHLRRVWRPLAPPPTLANKPSSVGAWRSHRQHLRVTPCVRDLPTYLPTYLGARTVNTSVWDWEQPALVWKHL